MIHEKSYEKRLCLIGGGGYKCPCCGPINAEHKRLLSAECRRRSEAIVKKMVDEEIYGIEPKTTRRSYIHRHDYPD